MNLQSLRAKLLQVERQRQQLEKRIQTSSKKQLEKLPGKVGLKSIDDLILELLPYASARVRGQATKLNGDHEGAAVAATTAPRRGRPPKSASGAPAKSAAKSKGTRYASETKDAIKAALEQGGQTVAQLSEKFGVSSFSINQWKMRCGLT